MQKTMQRLSTLNSFQYHGINQWYMVFRREINGSYHWQYEWMDVDCEPHCSGWFNKVEHVIKSFVQIEQTVLKNIHEYCPDAIHLYSDDEIQKIILNKIAILEDPQTRDWLLHIGE